MTATADGLIASLPSEVWVVLLCTWLDGYDSEVDSVWMDERQAKEHAASLTCPKNWTAHVDRAPLRINP